MGSLRQSQVLKLLPNLVMEEDERPLLWKAAFQGPDRLIWNGWGNGPAQVVP